MIRQHIQKLLGLIGMIILILVPAGCGMDQPQRAGADGYSMVSRQQKKRYVYDHIIAPDPNYKGLGGGTMTLPGANYQGYEDAGWMDGNAAPVQDNPVPAETTPAESGQTALSPGN